MPKKPAGDSELIGIPLVWIGMEETQAAFANAVLFQMGGDVQHMDEFTLTFGQINSPPLMGTPEENRKMLNSLPYVPVRVVSKLALSEKRVRELVELLEKILKKYDDVQPKVEQQIVRSKKIATRSRRGT